MTVLVPVDEFSDVIQYEISTVALGGDDSPMNVPLQQLTNRTYYLLNLVQALTTEVGTKLPASSYNDRWKGKHLSKVALETAYPVGQDGWYAHVDPGAGVNARNYIWDAQEGWVDSGEVAVGATTDEVPEGSLNRYFSDVLAIAAVMPQLAAVKVPYAGTAATVSPDVFTYGCLKYIACTNAAAVELTIDASSIVDVVVGQGFSIFQDGDGEVTVTITGLTVLGGNNVFTAKGEGKTFILDAVDTIRIIGAP